ncbi:MAG: hypothetical protein EBY28_21600 [Betaproteobacteria bacterium]|nr:hypothetical protein [Betaproteobacteria bacterium]
MQRSGHHAVPACAAKILRYPLHDIAACWRSPLALPRGERLDPIDFAPPWNGHSDLTNKKSSH